MGGEGLTGALDATSVAELNPRQREATEKADGPVQVIAGPGTGKTRVLTQRILRLIRDEGADPHSILALTFTDKAAEEMDRRIRGSLASHSIAGQPTVSTFHAYCLDLVRGHPERLGYDAPPKLLVGPLFVQFVMRNVDALVTDHTDLRGKVHRFAADLADFASLCHDESLADEDLVPRVEAWLATVPEKERAMALRVRDLAASLPRLREIQRAHNVVTYGDLLTQAIRLVKENADIREELAARHAHVLVDEFQDNNAAQFTLVDLIAGTHARIFVVGDEDQSIYRFRGARHDLLAEFREHWTRRGRDVRVVPLEENYRSTPAIIDVCQTLIKNNQHRHASKKLVPAATARAEGPEKVRLHLCARADVEEDAVVHQVERCLAEGRRPGDIAILCRSLGHIRGIISKLRSAGIPIEVVGGGGLFASPAVREVLAWMRILQDPKDEIALHRCLHLRSFGLGAHDLRLLGRAAKDRRQPLFEVLQTLPTSPVEGLTPAAAGKVARFLDAYRSFHVEARPQTRPDVRGVIQDVVLFAGLRPQIDPTTARGRQNLAALGGLLGAAATYEEHYPWASLAGFIDYLQLLEMLKHDETLDEPSADATTVKVMTAHQAKGREFPVVIVPGVSDSFPSPNRASSQARKFLDHVTIGDTVDATRVEEERRVLYVALSRAQNELVLTTTTDRRRRKNDPDFAAEIKASPRVDVRIVTAAGVVPNAAVNGASRRRTEERLHYLLSPLASPTSDEAERHVEEILRLSARLVEGAARERLVAILQDQGIPIDTSSPTVREAIPGEKGPLSLSASSLNRYANCPRQFYYGHVAHVPEPMVGDAATRGTAIHAALEAFYRRYPKPTPRDVPELLTLLDKEADRLRFHARRERDQWLDRTREVLSTYIEEESRREGETIGVEERFTIALGDDVAIVGKIDRVDALPDGRVRVTDYKSGELGTPTEYLEEDFQMPIYAWAVQEALAKPLAAVEVVSVRDLERTKAGSRIERRSLAWETGRNALTADLLKNVKTRVSDIVRGIRAGHFDPAPSEDACRFCSYKLLCPAAWGTEEGGDADAR